jgi:hypothetical protein
MPPSAEHSEPHQHTLKQISSLETGLRFRLRLSKPAWALVALILGWAAQELFERQLLWPGLLLYAIAIPLFAIKVAVPRPKRSEKPEVYSRFLYLRIGTGIRTQLGLGVMLGALILSGVSWYLFGLGPRSIAAWPTYLGSLIFFGLGVWLAEPSTSSRSSPPAPGKGRPSLRWPQLDLLLLAIIILALFLRLFQFSSLPFGTWYDEATTGLEARQIVQDPAFRPAYSGAMNQVAHHLYLFALSMRLLGDNIGALRAVSVLFGIGAVVTAYLFGREYGGRRWGLLLAFLVASMRWHVNFSRIAMNGIDVPFFEFLTLYFALRVVRGQPGQLRNMAWLGLSLGLGLSFYTPFRLFTIALTLFALAMLASGYRSHRDAGLSPGNADTLTARREYETKTNGKEGERWGLGLVLLLIAIWLAAMPTAQSAWRNGSAFWGRARHVSIFQNRDDPNLARALGRTTYKHLLMFNYQGDNNGRHNLPGAPTLDRLSAILFALGLGVAVARRGPANIFFLCLLPMGLLGGILTLDFEAPQSLRSIAALPAVVYFIALTLDTLWSELPVTGRFTGWQYNTAPILAGLGIIAFSNGFTYFGPQAHHPAVWMEFSTAETLVGKRMAKLGPEPVYYTSPFFFNHACIRFHAPESRRSARKVLPLPDPLPARESPDRPVVYFIHPDEEWVLHQALQIYPEASYEILPSDSEYPPAVYIVTLEPEQIASVQGLEATYWAGTTRQGVPGSTARSPVIDMVWPADAPLDLPFVAEWNGILYIPRYGQYNLSVEVPGPVELTLDGKTHQAEGNLSLTPDLAQGNHDMRLQATGGHGQVRLWWQPPTQEREIVPTWALYASPISRHGLLGKYYPNSDWSGTPAMARIDPFLDIYFHLTPLPRPYSVEWSGWLDVPEEGAYFLGLRAVDQAQLYLDGQLVIDATLPDEYTQALLGLKAGLHDLRITYQDLTGHSRIHLYWTRPGGEREIIPATYLVPNRVSSRSAQAPASRLPEESIWQLGWERGSH